MKPEAIKAFKKCINEAIDYIGFNNAMGQDLNANYVKDIDLINVYLNDYNYKNFPINIGDETDIEITTEITFKIKLQQI